MKLQEYHNNYLEQTQDKDDEQLASSYPDTDVHLRSFQEGSHVSLGQAEKVERDGKGRTSGFFPTWIWLRSTLWYQTFPFWMVNQPTLFGLFSTLEPTMSQGNIPGVQKNDFLNQLWPFGPFYHNSAPQRCGDLRWGPLGAASPFAWARCHPAMATFPMDWPAGEPWVSDLNGRVRLIETANMSEATKVLQAFRFAGILPSRLTWGWEINSKCKNWNVQTTRTEEFFWRWQSFDVLSQSPGLKNGDEFVKPKNVTMQLRTRKSSGGKKRFVASTGKHLRNDDFHIFPHCHIIQNSLKIRDSWPTWGPQLPDGNEVLSHQKLHDALWKWAIWPYYILIHSVAQPWFVLTHENRSNHFLLIFAAHSRCWLQNKSKTRKQNRWFKKNTMTMALQSSQPIKPFSKRILSSHFPHLHHAQASHPTKMILDLPKTPEKKTLIPRRDDEFPWNILDNSL